MKRILTAAALLLLAACLSGCLSSQLAEANLKTDNIGLNIEGKTIIEYDSLSYQLGHNNARNEFRVHDDDMKNGFILQCSETPLSKGQELSATVIYFVDGAEPTSEVLDCVIQTISPDGRIWLWDRKKLIGVIVQYKP